MIRNSNLVLGSILGVSLLLSHASFAGNSTGNGGDTVSCEKSAGNHFEGYWNLDYLLTYTSRNKNADVVQPKDWKESSDRILSLLKKKADGFSGSFQSFLNDMFNGLDYSKSHVWEQGSFGLVLLTKNDENYQFIDRNLPINCYKKSGNQDINLIRTITRTQKGSTAFYAYDEKIIQQLAPLQLSFLFVHEWLRSFTNDERIIRRVNRLLHSAVVEPPDYDLAGALAKIGLEPLDYPDAGFVSFCDRSTKIREYLELHYGRACREIAPSANDDGWNLNLMHSEVDILNPGDFGGLFGLRGIYLTQNDLKDLPTGVFRQMRNLLGIHLSYNHLSMIHRRSFFDVYAEELDLSHNNIEKLEDSAFQQLYTHDLNLEGNKIQSLNSRIFQGMHGIAPERGWSEANVNLHFASNSISELGEEAFSLGGRIGVLDLSFNKLKTINSKTFVNLRLTDVSAGLNLEHNEIESIAERAFDSVYVYFTGTGISLAHNRIEALSPNSFHELDTGKLDLSYNQLKNIPEDAFSGATMVHNYDSDGYYPGTLDLSHNQIETLAPNSFRNVVGPYLNLSQNKLRAIPVELVNQVKSRQIERLDLKGNPLCQDPAWRKYLTEQIGKYITLD